jgi:flagellar basal-body rod modification protein FlgD
MDKLQMSSIDLARTNIQVNELNKKIGDTKPPEEGKKALGKDSFLKLLVTQLQHQDPTKPMEDREFIAQMAQFSSLEQITNLNREIKSLLKSSESSMAYGILGKRVDSYSPLTKKVVSGIAESVKYAGDQVRVMVGKNEVSLSDINAVHHVEKNSTIDVKK